MKKIKNDKTIKRLEYLYKMLSKYKHRWALNEYPSNRLASWVHEYEEIKEEKKDAFNEYCLKNGYYLGHDSDDILA